MVNTLILIGVGQNITQIWTQLISCSRTCLNYHQIQKFKFIIIHNILIFYTYSSPTEIFNYKIQEQGNSLKKKVRGIRVFGWLWHIEQLNAWEPTIDNHCELHNVVHIHFRFILIKISLS